MAKARKAQKREDLLWDRTNYIIFIVGILVIILGFVLMSGGRSPDPNVFNPDEIYSFRRITLAPIVVLLGYGIVIFAIFKKKKQRSDDDLWTS
ncbi:MAG: DUF3098 domain-containing protein [Chlorobi bacterium]|nr:DUF3098 domain-containing protein [Chlorobiota bacterium]